MKKALPLLLFVLLLSACTTQDTKPVSIDRDAKVSSGPLLINKQSKYTFSYKMEQPELSKMTNWESMLLGFHQGWKKDFKITSEESDYYYSKEFQSYCSGGITLHNVTQDQDISISYQDFIKPGAKFQYTGHFDADPIPLDLDNDQKQKFTKQGRLITKANSGFLDFLKQANSYELDASPASPSEEWVNTISKIGGSSIEYQRYPFNTLFVSTDLVLHLYHKVFDNSLKYYEETKARPIVQDFSQSMLDKFSTLANKESNKDTKRFYDFLSAYWMIPNILLISQDDIMKQLQDASGYYDGTEDITDTQIKEMILKKMDALVAKYNPVYKTEIVQSIHNILTGTETEQPDALVYGFVGDFDPNFSIKQDYTQFVPRSHYTDSSLLKTYFMAMKWLMREKFYFSQKDLAKASLIMNQHISDKDLGGINLLQEFVSKIVGQDDDVNITDIKGFITQKKWKSDLEITTNVTDKIQDELSALRPQKIISTHYTTQSTTPTETEASAKDKTAGFVFFGEKFTIDSWLFDQMTAGSAEEESKIKPSVQSSLAIADILFGTNSTLSSIKQWFETYAKEFKITQSQIDAYPQVKDQALQQFSGLFTTGTVYAKRLDLLAWNMKTPQNAPYFMDQDAYQDKNLNTFLGNYTELKHDTLLYSKQAYAEMGMGGDEPCFITVYPPALPVPKGYVEPNIDMYDSLIALTEETAKFFDSESYSSFIEYLKFLRNIAISESKNEKISDADFDKLRLYYDQLYGMVLEQKTIGSPSVKSARGSIIADIFTSGEFGPLYVATGRPALMLLMVNDVNGSRVVWGPVYSTYEFYGKPFPMTSGRYTDEDWQQAYDTLDNETSIMSLPFRHLLDTK